MVVGLAALVAIEAAAAGDDWRAVDGGETSHQGRWGAWRRSPVAGLVAGEGHGVRDAPGQAAAVADSLAGDLADVLLLHRYRIYVRSTPTQPFARCFVGSASWGCFLAARSHHGTSV